MEPHPAPLPFQPQKAKMLIFIIVTTLGHFPSRWPLAGITAVSPSYSMWPNTITQVASYVLTTASLKYFNEEYEIK